MQYSWQIVKLLIESRKKQNDKEKKKCTHKSKHVRKVAPEWRLYSLPKAIKVSINLMHKLMFQWILEAS